MDLRTLLFSIFVLSVVNCQSDVKQLPDIVSPNYKNSTEIQQNLNTSVILPTTLQNLCTICSCGLNFVNCTQRNLNNTFEDAQWPKQPIVEISFRKNKLVHIKPFPSVVIERLILRQNQITRIDNSAFKKIINLTELDLSHNELTTENLKPQVFEGRFSPEAYEPLSKLIKLNLANNALHALDQDLFEHVPSLKVLILNGNPLKMVEGHTTLAINSLPYLEELDISFCDLDELPKHIFYKPRYLKKLVLNGNRFNEIPKALARATAVEILSLDENPIKIINRLNAFPLMPNLKELNMCCMPDLIEIGSESFSKLIGLEILRIQNCPLLKKIDENALKKEMAVWPPLKILDLSDNALRYLPSQLVERWDRLEELDLMNNEWSCDCNNQYLINSLLPHHGKRLMGEEVNELKCNSPLEYSKQNLMSLGNKKLHCFDIYESHSSKIGVLHIGVVVGLLFIILLSLAIIILYQRGYFILCSSPGAATYSRAFYKRTSNDYDI
ncbi:leucine-rich repeat neuronal protein 2-like isoform X1 [Vespa velutina]|uniref:leucine-rich repeat neuronal protein 2-like isoform X1 n=1 Tax=Vespa velutina TaxID=202808 RepID=UPI001FB4B0C7|nr:leucine-rich repeat neuronal protein 2-like isoform X1 [Vespa velutina]